MDAKAKTPTPTDGEEAVEPQGREAKLKKLAAFLIVLGPELASELLKGFDPRDVREISLEMAKMDLVDHKTQRKVMEEFSKLAADAVVSAAGGTQFTRQVLEKSLGSFQANEMLQSVSPSPVSKLDASVLQELDARQLFNLIKQEDPQTVAFILSYLEPSKCGEALGYLTPDMRTEVVTRIASMEPVPSDVLGKVLTALNKQIMAVRALSTKSGGLKSIADVINSMDPTMGRALMSSLDEKNPELSGSIKKILFSFEDLRKLDVMSLQRVLREVESRDLVLSLKTASEPLKVLMFSALPKRAAENIKDEIKMTGPVRIMDIEAAQERILEAMRKLEAEGQIVVGGGAGKGDVVA